MVIALKEGINLQFHKHLVRLKDKMFSKKLLKHQLHGHTIDIRNSNDLYKI